MRLWFKLSVVVVLATIVQVSVSTEAESQRRWEELGRPIPILATWRMTPRTDVASNAPSRFHTEHDGSADGLLPPARLVSHP